jgi:chorismate synthase
VIIDGVPARLKLTEADIQPQLDRRRPGQSAIATKRNEADQVQILSGTEFGLTLGTPMGCKVDNKDQRPQDYAFTLGEGDDKKRKREDETNGAPDYFASPKDLSKFIPRPSHADFTYYAKYGTHASSGGGRSSARETIGRVIGGTVAEKCLMGLCPGYRCVAWVSGVGPYSFDITDAKYGDWLHTITREEVDETMVRCPDKEIAQKMQDLIVKLAGEGDSTGGTVTCIIHGVPAGLGEPCFDKLEALLAHAMMSIPATKGFEIGSGFEGTKMNGSEHNDMYVKKGDRIGTTTNKSGGVQGGISNGEPIILKMAFKPPATIAKGQDTCNMSGDAEVLAAKGRHDPCVVNRAIPIVEAMASMTILDAYLQQKGRM